MADNKVNNSPTAEMVREQLANAGNVIAHVLNDALRAGTIDVARGQEFMDLFSRHSKTMQHYLLTSNPRFDTDKGFAAQAVLNMVTIALAAGSREPNLALAILKHQQRSLPAMGRAAQKPILDAAKMIVEDELKKFRQEHPKHKLTGNGLAGKIKDKVNTRRGEAGLKHLRQNSLGKRINKLLRPDA
jgi:hypothetical protein